MKDLLARLACRLLGRHDWVDLSVIAKVDMAAGRITIHHLGWICFWCDCKRDPVEVEQ